MAVIKSVDPAKQASIASRIVAALRDLAMEAWVADVRIGLGYTAVHLADECLGMAFTFHGETRGCCSVFQKLQTLSRCPASDLLVLLESSDTIEAGVGLACANALINRSTRDFRDGDVLDHLDLREGDRVGMVGNFDPIVQTLKARAVSLTVFERVKQPSGDVRPAEEAGETLQQCQVALITATSIINHTIDELLEAAGDCREVVVLGASTPLLLEPFVKANVTLLSGVVVEDPGEVLRVVSEGGGMRMFKPYVRKVNLRVPNNKNILRGKNDGREQMYKLQ